MADFFPDKKSRINGKGQTHKASADAKKVRSFGGLTIRVA